MTGPMRTILVAAALAASVVFANPPVQAATDALTPDSLSGNTLVWPRPDGENTLIYFGRFGNFDRYVPCTFESGTWTLGPDRQLNLTYDRPSIEPQRFGLTKQGDGVAMTAPDGSTFVAELQEGDHLPWF